MAEGVTVLVIDGVIHTTWGKGPTEAACSSRAGIGGGRKYVAYHVHPDTFVDGKGRIVHPPGHPPEEILRVGYRAPGDCSRPDYDLPSDGWEDGPVFVAAEPAAGGRPPAR